MPHRQRGVRLTVPGSGDERDGPSWNQFPNKDNAAAPALGHLPTNVKAQKADTGLARPYEGLFPDEVECDAILVPERGMN